MRKKVAAVSYSTSGAAWGKTQQKHHISADQKIMMVDLENRTGMNQ